MFVSFNTHVSDNHLKRLSCHLEKSFNTLVDWVNTYQSIEESTFRGLCSQTDGILNGLVISGLLGEDEYGRLIGMIDELNREYTHLRFLYERERV